MSLRYALNGVLPVYKPKGWTSRKAVDVVKDRLSNDLWINQSKVDLHKLKRKDQLKVGHGGTLDPMAKGVLVLGVGKGCKQMDQFLQGSKEYMVTSQFGQSTDTYDAEGKIIELGKTDHLTQHLLEQTLPLFRGQITQVPPIHSALKMKGKRLYDYARNNLELPEPIAPRTVRIDQLDLADYDPVRHTCVLRVVCGGGTYMRSLVNDLAIAMGTRGHMTELERTRQGQFVIDDTLLLDDSFTLDTCLDRMIAITN
ncbi:putative tRNA pseudouridine synthase 1-like protein [Choanephora cucurbitarum]|nr:putative tRNA pseudouridine synthase 1-like protein [Choanephora cucurbitarum]